MRCLPDLPLQHRSFSTDWLCWLWVSAGTVLSGTLRCLREPSPFNTEHRYWIILLPHSELLFPFSFIDLFDDLTVEFGLMVVGQQAVLFLHDIGQLCVAEALQHG